MEPRRGDETPPWDRLAETQDNRLLGLLHRERRSQRNDQDKDDGGDCAESGRALHLRPPSPSRGVKAPSGK